MSNQRARAEWSPLSPAPPFPAFAVVLPNQESSPASPPRRRLLFLSHRLPFPTHNGAAIRTYNLLRELSADFDITLLCFDRADGATRRMPLSERIAAFPFVRSVEVFSIPQESSRRRFLCDHLRSVVTGRPYTWYVHDSAPYVARVAALLASGAFDLVHLDSMDLVRLLPLIDGTPVACTHHNVESELLARRAGVASNPLTAAYLRFQARRLASAEREWLPRIGINFAVSRLDAERFARLAPAARVAVIPNGVDASYFRPTSDARDGCVFVGGTTWFPNRDALAWFVADVLPALRRRGVRAPVTWVGRCTEEERERYAAVRGLTLTGYVDDIRPYLERAACFIAPIRVGGGTRLKLLDAWAAGKAIVSTSIGAEGLDARHGEDMLIADSAEEFAQSVADVLADAALRRRLGAAGRTRAEREFSWKRLGGRMSDLLRALNGGGAAIPDEAVPVHGR